MSEVALDNTSFAIKTPVFEGPLELLLDLVEKRKLLINDISLAEVTDEYMTQVSEMQAASLPGTAHFVALAATLLLIKSKSLLPVLELTNEEEQAIEDLGERLRLYQIYRVAGAEIADLFGAAYLHERQYKPHTEPLFLPDQYCTKQMLAEAMQGVLANLPKTEQRPKVRVRKSVSLEDMMSRLQERIEAQMRITFRELLREETEKVTVIVGFLAILESVKQGSVLVAQTERFEDIDIASNHTTLPNYQ